jgi:hypothetical protein
MTPPASASAAALRTRRASANPAASLAGRAATRPAPLTVPRRPRRVSGPARPAVSDQPRRRSSADERGLAIGLIDALARLSEHRLLDRLIKGRIWIVLIAFALIGIVTMQLGLLKLNGEIGRTLAREAVVQRENAALSIENSELAASNGVESRAARLGMGFVPLSALHFLAAGPNVDRAGVAAALSARAHPTVTTSAEAPSTETASGAAGAESQPGAEQSTASAAAGSSPTSSTTSSSPVGAAAAAPAEAKAPAAEQAPASGTSAAGAATVPAPGTGSTEVAPAGGTAAAPTGG